MALEATLGNANLLQLAEALSLNAKKVQSDWNSNDFGGNLLIHCSSYHRRSAMNWSDLLMVQRAGGASQAIERQSFVPMVA